MNTKTSPLFFLKPRMNRSASLLQFCVALASLPIILALTACDTAEPVAQSTSEPGRPVRVAEVRPLSTAETLRVPGALRAVERAHLAFLQPGYLAERRVERGQAVISGQVLAILHNPALQPGVAAAEASVNEARSRLEQLERDTERLTELVQRNLASDDELEQTRANRDVARATLNQAEARRDEARNQLLDASLRAPFDGRIVELHLEPGDFAGAGQAVLTINGNNGLEVELQLPGWHAAALAIDQAVDILRVNDGRSATARIHEIGQAQPGQTAAVIGRLNDESNADWQAGDAVYIELELQGSEVLSVPLSAIINPGTQYSRVFRVRDNRAELVPIETGRTLRGWAQVSGPLSTNDRIVIAGQAQLLDGEPVRIIE